VDSLRKTAWIATACAYLALAFANFFVPFLPMAIIPFHVFMTSAIVLLYRPFDMHDVVEVGGVNGRVADMSMVSTTILSPDNQRYVVPNSKIWGNVIRNVTAQHTRRVDLTFGIGYESDIRKAESLLNDVVHAHPLVLKNPEPSGKVSKLTPTLVEFAVRPWCKTDDVWTVTTDITRSVKVRFDEEGIAFK